MKKMFKVLAGVGLVLALAMPADAAWSIRQKANGSTVWTDGSIEVPTGDTGLVVPISDFSSAITYYVVTHKKGKIKKVYVVNLLPFPAQSGAPTLNMGVNNGTTGGFTPISTGATLTMTTSLYAGRVSSVSPNDVNVNVLQGSVVSVKVGGSSILGAVPGNVVIVIE